MEARKKRKRIPFLVYLQGRNGILSPKFHRINTMFSILIPTYRYDCTKLAASLCEQGRTLREELGREAFDFEVLVSDDGSGADWTQRLDAGLAAYPECRVLAQQHNRGRAVNRNALLKAARFPWLLMIDCDTDTCTDDFVSSYWKRRLEADVVCGSLRNPDCCEPGHELRFRYEKAAEQHRSAAFRNRQPYSNFTTFNILFSKRAIAGTGFDERCTEYGYEDALMGLTFRDRGISVLHIDNPLIHKGIDSNAEFLQKTEAALRVLSRLGDPMQAEAGASRLYRKLQLARLDGALRQLFRCTGPLLRRNLLGRHPSLLLFSFYKAGYYAAIASKK